MYCMVFYYLHFLGILFGEYIYGLLVSGIFLYILSSELLLQPHQIGIQCGTGFKFTVATRGCFCWAVVAMDTICAGW